MNHPLDEQPPQGQAPEPWENPPPPSVDGSDAPWHRPREYAIATLLALGTFGTTWLISGEWYAFSLMLILGAHEFGHYWACRRNGVRSSLPYFLPAPPVFLAGTFGAFIHIKEPIRNRRVLMEIGAAGPIAGFAVALPLLIIGLQHSKVGDAEVLRQGFNFGSSLALNFVAKMILGVDPSSPDVNVSLHPIAFAAWIGMFVTAINLLPIGQLDGGQVCYALFRERYHALGWIFFFALLLLGFYWSGWWLFAFMTALLFRFRSAPIIDDDLPLQAGHEILGYLAIVIFIVTFIPVPIEWIP